MRSFPPMRRKRFLAAASFAGASCSERPSSLLRLRVEGLLSRNPLGPDS